jgi:hypothetical protein
MASTVVGAEFMRRALCIALFILVVVATLYMWLLLAEYDVGGDSPLYVLYTVHRRGNVTLLLLNRTALKYVNGFWVAMLRGINGVDVSAEIIRILGAPVEETADISIENGELRVVRGVISDDNVLTALLNAGLKSTVLRVSVLSDGSLWLVIDRVSVEELGAENLANVVASAVPGKRVIVQEVISLGRLPSYFDALDMYKSLEAIPCFKSLGEGGQGLVIIFNRVCAQEIASQANITLDQVIENIVDKLREVTPLLKKYLYSREFLVVFEDVKEAIPLPLVSSADETGVNVSPSTSTLSIEHNKTPLLEAFGIIPVIIVTISIVGAAITIRKQT